MSSFTNTCVCIVNVFIDYLCWYTILTNLHVYKHIYRPCNRIKQQDDDKKNISSIYTTIYGWELDSIKKKYVHVIWLGSWLAFFLSLFVSFCLCFVCKTINTLHIERQRQWQQRVWLFMNGLWILLRPSLLSNKRNNLK